MAHNPWSIVPGLNNVGSYQVSGKPYASGAIEAPRSSSNSLVVRFPQVTSWFQIVPMSVQAVPSDQQRLRVAFSENGLHNQSFFRTTLSSSIGQIYKMKTSELWFMEDSNLGVYEFDIVAGLTNLPASRTDVTADRAVDGTIKAAGPNFTGSIGVG